MCVHADGFAGFAEFFAIVILARRFHRHAAKDASTAARRRKRSFDHASILGGLQVGVNQEANWMYRILNGLFVVAALCGPFLRSMMKQ